MRASDIRRGQAVIIDGKLFVVTNADHNTPLTAMFHNGKVVSYEMPKTVDLKVTETPPGIKGATATNQMKDATLETGLKTRVPPFIEEGETLRISTETGQYLSRA